jgi:hypothetical protein
MLYAASVSIIEDEIVEENNINFKLSQVFRKSEYGRFLRSLIHSAHQVATSIFLSADQNFHLGTLKVIISITSNLGDRALTTLFYWPRPIMDLNIKRHEHSNPF